MYRMPTLLRFKYRRVRRKYERLKPKLETCPIPIPKAYLNCFTLSYYRQDCYLRYLIRKFKLKEN